MTTRKQELIDEANHLTQLGLDWVPITRGYRQTEDGQWLRETEVGKGPRIKDWQTYDFGKLSAEYGWREKFSFVQFEEGDNLGFRLGQQRCGSFVVCVDLDHPSAVRLANEYLPPTGVIIGRAANPRCHWFYVLTEGDQTLKESWRHGSEGLFIELLAAGQQVLIGPSVHPSGDLYDMLHGVPATIGVQDIKAACQRLFAACLSDLGLEPDAAPPQGRGLSVSPIRETSPQAPRRGKSQVTVLESLKLRQVPFYSGISSDTEVYIACPDIASHGKHGTQPTQNKCTDCSVRLAPNGVWIATCRHECSLSWERIKALYPIPRRTPAVDLSGLLNRGAK